MAGFIITPPIRHPCSLSPTVAARQASFPAAQIGRLASLVRWYIFLQHTADPSGIYPRVSIPVPPLRLPTLSAAATPRVHAPSRSCAFRALASFLCWYVLCILHVYPRSQTACLIQGPSIDTMLALAPLAVLLIGLCPFLKGIGRGHLQAEKAKAEAAPSTLSPGGLPKQDAAAGKSVPSVAKPTASSTAPGAALAASMPPAAGAPAVTAAGQKAAAAAPNGTPAAEAAASEPAGGPAAAAAGNGADDPADDGKKARAMGRAAGASAAWRHRHNHMSLRLRLSV